MILTIFLKERIRSETNWHERLWIKYINEHLIVMQTQIEPAFRVGTESKDPFY